MERAERKQNRTFNPRKCSQASEKMKNKKIIKYLGLSLIGFCLLVGLEYWLIKAFSQRKRSQPLSVSQFYQPQSYSANGLNYLNTILVSVDWEKNQIIVADKQIQAVHLITPQTKLILANQSGVQEISREKLSLFLKPREPIAISFAPSQPTQLISLTVFQL